MKPRLPAPWPHLRIDAAGAVVCAALAAGFYFLGIAPLNARRLADQAGRERVVALDAEAAQARTELAAAAHRLDETRRRVREAAVTLERTDRLNARVAELNVLAGDNGLQIDEIKPGTADQAPWFTRMPIRLSGNGPYRAGMLFLHRLNRQFPDMGLAGFEVRGDPGTDDTPAIFMFDLVWYAAPPTSADASK